MTTIYIVAAVAAPVAFVAGFFYLYWAGSRGVWSVRVETVRGLRAHPVARAAVTAERLMAVLPVIIGLLPPVD